MPQGSKWSNGQNGHVGFGPGTSLYQVTADVAVRKAKRFMKKNMVVLIGLTVALGVGAALVMAARSYAKRDVELSQRPPRESAPAPVPAGESHLGTEIVLPYAVLMEALNKAAPVAETFSGREPFEVNVDKQVQKTVEEQVGGDVGKVLGGLARVVTKVITVNQSEKVKGAIDYAVTIRRDGPIRLSVHHDRLRVAIPLSVRGHAGLTGDAAKALGLDRKNFKGAITALADCQFGLSRGLVPGDFRATGLRLARGGEGGTGVEGLD